MGGDTHLASITSIEHQTTVAHLAAEGTGDPNAWIGLNDIEEEGSFVWADDEPLEYSNWPLRLYGDGDAITVSTSQDSKWYDDFVTTPHPFVCAKRARPGESSLDPILSVFVWSV